MKRNRYSFFCRNRVPVRNPKSLTQHELEGMAQAILDQECEEEVGGELDTSSEEIIE